MARPPHFFDAVVEALYGGRAHSPYTSDDEPMPIDLSSYPHTHLPEDLVEQVLAAVQEEDAPLLAVELGSFVGGSAVRIARALKRLGRDGQGAALVCIDPFCGDANMWADHNGWRAWLQLRGGRPRLFEQFVANVRSEAHDDMIVPLAATACVGCAVLRRLAAAGPGGAGAPALPRPRLIYLDSAHEEGETLVEIQKAFALLAPGGVLLGDDWDWPAVRADVTQFARAQAAPLPVPALSGGATLSPAPDAPGVVVFAAAGGGTPQWLVQKPRGCGGDGAAGGGGDAAATAARACTAAEAQASMLRLAQAVAAGRGDLPELAVWAQAAAADGT